MGIFALEYYPRGYIKDSYYQPFSEITADIIRIKVLFQGGGGPYMRKNGIYLQAYFQPSFRVLAGKWHVGLACFKDWCFCHILY